VYVVELSAQLQPVADPRQVVPSHSLRINGLTWNRTGTELVFGAIRQDSTAGLWRVPIPNTATAPPSELQVGVASWPSAARLSSRLAFNRSMGGGQNIWRLQIPTDNKTPKAPTFLIVPQGETSPRVIHPTVTGSHLSHSVAEISRSGRATTKDRIVCRSRPLARHLPAFQVGRPTANRSHSIRGRMTNLTSLSSERTELACGNSRLMTPTTSCQGGPGTAHGSTILRMPPNLCRSGKSHRKEALRCRSREMAVSVAWNRQMADGSTTRRTKRPTPAYGSSRSQVEKKSRYFRLSTFTISMWSTTDSISWRVRRR